MSGPSYPRYVPGTGPGENAIGSFVIGVSPIGTISPFDVWTTVISQYANSPILTTLITNFAAYIDPTENLDAFFDDIWNIDTAQGFGLDVWGRILGVSRVISVPLNTVFFGFKEAGDPTLVGFGQGVFFLGEPLNDNFALADSAFRVLLLAKAFSNISDGSIASLNQLLLSLFPSRGNCYVTDGLDMTMTYTFAFGLTAVELAIVESSGALPRPTGVSVTIVAP